MALEESQVDENLDPNEEVEEAQVAETKLSYEDLAAEVSRLRRENASKRVKAKDLDDKLKKYSEWEKSQMSELERAKAEKADVERQLRELTNERLQATAAKKAKLDPDLADRIKGETEEEMLEDARRLAKRYPATASSADTMFAGTRGRPVGDGKEESESDWFRNQFSK